MGASLVDVLVNRKRIGPKEKSGLIEIESRVGSRISVHIQIMPATFMHPAVVLADIKSLSDACQLRGGVWRSEAGSAKYFPVQKEIR